MVPGRLGIYHGRRHSNMKMPELTKIITKQFFAAIYIIIFSFSLRCWFTFLRKIYLLSMERLCIAYYVNN